MQQYYCDNISVATTIHLCIRPVSLQDVFAGMITEVPHMQPSQQEIEATTHPLDAGMTIHQNTLHLNKARQKQVILLLLLP